MGRENRKYWIKHTAFTLLFVAAICTGAALALERYGPIGLLVCVLAISIGGVLLFSWWHVRSTLYLCPRCGHAFGISVWRDIGSLNFFDKQLLPCPRCGKRSWCKSVGKQAVEEFTGPSPKKIGI